MKVCSSHDTLRDRFFPSLCHFHKLSNKNLLDKLVSLFCFSFLTAILSDLSFIRIITSRAVDDCFEISIYDKAIPFHREAENALQVSQDYKVSHFFFPSLTWWDSFEGHGAYRITYSCLFHPHAIWHRKNGKMNI